MPDALDPPVPYQALVEHLPVVVYVASDEPPPRTLYISPNVEQVIGYRASTFLSLGPDWTSMLHPDDVQKMNDAYEASYGAGRPFFLEYRFVHPDGRIVWVRDHAVPYVDPDTGKRLWQGLIEDVSDRVAAEERVDVSETRYATLIENLPAVVYEMVPDDDRRTRYVNRKIEALLGYTMEEWLQQPDMWMEVLHPDDRELELAAHDLHSATGDAWQREYRLIDVRGEVVWVRDQATLVRGPDGNPLHWQGVMVDITAEKEAQGALQRAHDELEFRVRARTAQLEQANEAMGMEIAERQRAEEARDRAATQLEQIIENVPAVVYVWQVREQEDGSWVTFVGDQIAPMLGYTVEEWSDGSWRDRVHPHDRERVHEAAQRCIDRGEPFQMEYRYLARDGRVVWVLDQANLLARNDAGEPLLYEGVMIDVTAQREAESVAETATDRLRELVERGPAILYGYSVTGDPPTAHTDYVSPMFADLLGIDPAELAGDPRRWFDMIHPDDLAGAIERSERAWATGASWDNEYRMLRADGQIIWVWDRGRCVRRDDEGRPHRFVGSLIDTTTRRNEVDEIAASAERLGRVSDGFPGVLWTFMGDPSTHAGRFTFLSRGTEELTGYSAAELIGERNHLERILHPDDLERIRELDRLSDETGVWDAIYRIRRRDGELRWLHSVGRRHAEPGTGEEVWHGVAIDVTDQMTAADARADLGVAEALEEHVAAPPDLSPPVA